MKLDEIIKRNPPPHQIKMVQSNFLWNSTKMEAEAPPLPLLAITWNAAAHSMVQRNPGLR